MFESHNYIYNSLYINLVAILETYLQDRLYEELKSDSSKIHKLVLNYNLERKFAAKDIIEGPNPIAQEILDGIIYHNLPAVNVIYKIIFNVDILALMKNKRTFEIIKIRHKIVHSREFNKYMKIEICKISQQDVLDKILEQVYDDKHYKKRQNRITI